MERIVTRIALGSASPRDLARLRASLAAWPQIRALVEKLDAPALVRTFRRPAALSGRTRPAMSAPWSINRRRRCAKAASSRADSMRNSTACAISRRTPAASSPTWKRSERERTGIASLKVGYNRVHGYYIETNRAAASEVPAEYIRRQTLKNAERYITPTLKRVRRRGADEPGAGAAPGKAALRQVVVTAGRVRRGIADRRRGAGRPGCAGRVRRPGRGVGTRRTRVDRCPRHAHSRGTPSGRRVPVQCAIRAKRPRPRRFAAHAGDHRSQHGRKVDLYAPDRVDRPARPHGLFRPRDVRRYRTQSTAFSHASARPTT